MKPLSDSILRHISNDLASMTAIDVAERVENGLHEDAADMPYPLASVVCIGHDRYLVGEISYVNCGSQPATYSLRGHPDLGTTPSTRAWKDHEDLQLVMLPSQETWTMLKDAVRIDQESRIMTVVPARG